MRSTKYLRQLRSTLLQFRVILALKHPQSHRKVATHQHTYFVRPLEPTHQLSEDKRRASADF